MKGHRASGLVQQCAHATARKQGQGVSVPWVAEDVQYYSMNWAATTPLHRAASTAREKGFGVRFRDVVSANPLYEIN